MIKKLFGLCVLMFLVLMAFVLPGTAMANNIGGVPPGDIVAMVDIDTVIAAMSCMAGGDDCGKRNIFLKDDTVTPFEKGSAISPIACGNNDLLHGHPGGVSMALT